MFFPGDHAVVPSHFQSRLSGREMAQRNGRETMEVPCLTAQLIPLLQHRLSRWVNDVRAETKPLEEGQRQKRIELWLLTGGGRIGIIAPVWRTALSPS